MLRYSLLFVKERLGVFVSRNSLSEVWSIKYDSFGLENTDFFQIKLMKQFMF